MHGEEVLAAEEGRHLERLRGVLAEIDVGGAEDEEVVGAEGVVLGQGGGREGVLRRQFVKAEASFQQRLQDLLGGLLDVDPQPVVGAAAPLVDQLRAALPELSVTEQGDPDGGGHSS